MRSLLEEALAGRSVPVRVVPGGVFIPRGAAVAGPRARDGALTSRRLVAVAPDDLPVPPIRGGSVETTVAALTEQWARRHEVTLLSVADPALPAREGCGRLTHVRIPRNGKGAYVERCAAAIAGEAADVVVVFNRPGWVVPLRRRFPATPLVLSLHSRRLSWLGRSAARRCLRSAAAIVTVSRSLRRDVLRHDAGAARRTLAVPTGVDAARFRPPAGEGARRRDELRGRYGLKGAVVLYAARLAPVKGLDLLVRAMRRVPDASLLVCGSNWLQHHQPVRFARRVRRQAARLGRRVAFAGFVPPPRVHEFFWAADILACPSRPADALPRALYEGMAAGLPVVAFTRGPASEVVRHGVNGLLARGTRGLARAISLLARDPARRAALGEAGRQLVLARYRWTDAADRWEEVLVRVTRPRTPGAGPA